MMNIIAASRSRSAPLVPSYLSLDKANEIYLTTIGSPFIFSGSFFVEVEFTYNSLTDSFAGVLGALSGINGSVGTFRLLINNSTILTSIAENSNMSFNFNSSFGEKIKVKITRNLFDEVFISINDNNPIKIGDRANVSEIKRISRVDNNDRFLDGNLYSLNVNGEIFELNEGSGNLINGSNGSQFKITTSSTDPNYIDNNVWVNL